MAVQTCLDECPSIRDGRLFVEECDADALARRFGTPIHVISEDQLRRNARRYRREFEQRWADGPVLVLASIKANFALATEHNRWTAIVANKADRPASQVADIVGLTCQPDRIVPQAQLPDVVPGDSIAILDTGAYQDGLACNFNALPRPGMVLVHGDQADWIKRPETVADVFMRDLVPARLRSPR